MRRRWVGFAVVLVIRLGMVPPATALTNLATLSFASGSALDTASGFTGETSHTVYLTTGETNASYTIYWDATSSGQSVNLGTCSTDGSGVCSLAITIPTTTQGNWLIHAETLTDVSNNTLTFSLNPKISLSSAAGVPGATTDITGTGFAGSQTITIKQDGADTGATTSSDSSGSFGAVTFTPTGVIGHHTLGAHDTAVNNAAAVGYDITGMSLGAPASASLSGVTLSGSPTSGSGSLGTLTVRDNRLTNVGWSVTVTSSDFSDGTHTLGVTNFTVTPDNASLTVVSGSGTGVAAGSTHQFSSTSDIATIASATSGHGNGEYTINPNLQLAVPVGTYAGTYTATITETIQ